MAEGVHAGVASARRHRIESVDVVRGVIMILMALDHTRDYFGQLGVSPTNLATTTAPLFFTRWITHICAPVFFLLTGTGGYLALRHRSRSELSRYLFTRGLWLIVLEFTVFKLVIQFNLDYRLTVVTVLWAIGWCMIALSALVFLPMRLVAAIGVGMIAGHNLLDPVRAQAFGSFAPLWTALHAPGFLLQGNHVVFAAYPLIPWIGVTALGYALGSVYDWEASRRRSFLVVSGLVVCAAFVVLRAVNIYGDPVPWAPQRSTLFTVLSFLNTSKYPPSLLFLLMTLGPALLLLRAFDARIPRLFRPALVIGKVPLFYFVLHFFLIHALTVVVSLARFGDAQGMFQSPTLDRYPITPPPGWPVSLPVVYAIWVGVVVATYPLCRWFAGVRKRRKEPWLSYL